jgi:hypothetical protein
MNPQDHHSREYDFSEISREKTVQENPHNFVEPPL